MNDSWRCHTNPEEYMEGKILNLDKKNVAGFVTKTELDLEIKNIVDRMVADTEIRQQMITEFNEFFERYNDNLRTINSHFDDIAKELNKLNGLIIGEIKIPPGETVQ